MYLIQDAVQGLTEAKMELRRQEQRVRHLQRQLQQMENEKKLLTDNITDAEKALKTTSKDREALISYIHGIERALLKVSGKEGEVFYLNLSRSIRFFWIEYGWIKAKERVLF